MHYNQVGDNVIDIVVSHKRFNKETRKYTVVVRRQAYEDAAVEDLPWFTRLNSYFKAHSLRFKQERMRARRVARLEAEAREKANRKAQAAARA